MVYIQPLDDDSPFSIPIPDPRFYEGPADVMVIGGLVEVVPPDADLRTELMAHYGEAGYQVRWIDITPIGISDDGFPITWVIAYLETR